ncbi:peptidyl-prolyl cis-trans isomerase FKBP20-2, chloroplastic isoform X1 [Nicotiana tomentosiformis]|uniref:peptidyl-prolyl cis-trans isomerase FKBP20-2, chloroplastic isoform X1 n=1 Tax=Nicotiana tomentosiformis TaxID=4098 RepID=UPI00388C8B00
MVPNSSFLLSKISFPYTLSACHTTHRQKSMFQCCSAVTLQDKRVREQKVNILHYEDNMKRRSLLFFLITSGISPALPAYGKTKSKNPYDERRLLEQNKRIQRENNAPEEFPSFIREGFEVKVVTSDNYVKRDSGLILWDIAVGEGDCPKDGQQVTFHYIGYNESGRRIDSTYLQNAPAKIRMGTNALVPGFEEGIRDMRPGGRRRIIIPPELGPPVEAHQKCPAAMVWGESLKRRTPSNSGRTPGRLRLGLQRFLAQNSLKYLTWNC